MSASSIIAEASMKAAGMEEAALNDSTDITISGDGSWKTRGHSSNVGVCTAIGVSSGKVVNIDVMSSFCKGCNTYKKAKSGTRYKSWQKQHMSSCQKSHHGSAGKMEVDGMKQIFQRSVAERKVHYLSYIGDGDTKTFKEISESQPYGADISIEKIECVGHIQKRMGTRLRKLKTNLQKKLSDGKTIGGKGRLIDSLIDKLTPHYGNAIRGNKDSAYDMRKNIWAI